MPPIFEMTMFRDVLGGLVDWGPLVTVLALLAVGLVYFLAPVLGYTTYNRGLLLGAMWVLIGKMALAILRAGIIFLQVMDLSSHSGSSMSSSSTEGKDAAMMLMLFGMLETGVFILAMALFAGGLASLRRDSDPMRRDRDLSARAAALPERMTPDCGDSSP